MMRVAYVCIDRGVPVFGRKGSSIHVREVMRSLTEKGARPELFATRIGGDPPHGLERVPVHRLPAGRKGEAVDKERSALDADRQLGATLAEAGPFDLVYERHALFSCAAMEYARDSGTPGLLEVNAPLIEEQRRYRSLVLQREAEQCERRAFAAASALLAVSDGVAEYLNGRPEARGRVHVIPNGVDPRRFRPDQPPALSAPSGVFTVGFVGTLKPWHGVGALIAAFAELYRADPQVRLLIVGDGPKAGALEADAAARGLGDGVLFTGAVDPDRIPSLLASMDVAVAPYPRLDGCYFSPLKLFEYMAAALPIVAAGIGQLAQVITDGVTGLLYPPGDTAALAGVLSRLKGDPDLRGRLGQAAREAALRHHTWDTVAGRILDLARAWAANDEATAQKAF